MKRIFAVLILAALSGCYSIRDFREWTDSQEHTVTMLINNNNALFRRVEALETDVRYLNRHATPFKTDANRFKISRRVSGGSPPRRRPTSPSSCRSAPGLMKCELRLSPKTIARFDYSTATPTLNIVKPPAVSSVAYVASVPKNLREYIYNAHPITGVDLEIETTGTIEGAEYRQISHQTAGNTSAGNPDCLYATLQIKGASANATRQSFTTARGASRTSPTTRQSPSASSSQTTSRPRSRRSNPSMRVSRRR